MSDEFVFSESCLVARHGNSVVSSVEWVGDGVLERGVFPFRLEFDTEGRLRGCQFYKNKKNKSIDSPCNIRFHKDNFVKFISYGYYTKGVHDFRDGDNCFVLYREDDFPVLLEFDDTGFLSWVKFYEGEPVNPSMPSSVSYAKLSNGDVIYNYGFFVNGWRCRQDKSKPVEASVYLRDGRVSSEWLTLDSLRDHSGRLIEDESRERLVFVGYHDNGVVSFQKFYLGQWRHSISGPGCVYYDENGVVTREEYWLDNQEVSLEEWERSPLVVRWKRECYSSSCGSGIRL